MIENTYLDKFRNLPEDPAPDAVTQTAEELRMLSFSPTLLIETPEFLYFTKAGIIAEAERIAGLPDERLPEFSSESFDNSDDFRRKHIDLLYYYYDLLARLRLNVPEAWDYVHELYEDD